MGVTELVSSNNHSEPKVSVFLAACNVAMVTYCAINSTTAGSLVAGRLCDTKRVVQLLMKYWNLLPTIFNKNNAIFANKAYLMLKCIRSKVFLHRLGEILNGIQDHAVMQTEKHCLTIS